MDLDDIDFDVSSILGMSSILNKEETDNHINLKTLEKEMLKEEFESDNSFSFSKKSYENDEDDNIMEYDPIEEYSNLLKNGDNRQDTSQFYSDSTLVELREEPVENNYENILTEEHNNQEIINSYFDEEESNKFSEGKQNISYPQQSNSNSYSYDFDTENREDMKLRLLEKIDNLKEELEDDGINLSKIPSVDFSSKLEEIENTAKLLMLKATRNRYSNMGEEFILAISNGLEILCNGKREFLGMRPDLTNCTDIVKVKLRRVKNETSQIVADVVEKYEIPPLFTVLIELVPALFLHSQRRSRLKSQHKSIAMDLSDDINEIRKYTT